MRTREVDPDAYLENADNERLVRIIIGMAKSGGYHEGTSKFEKWILTVLGALFVACVGAGIGLYAKVAALEERTVNIQAQVSDVKRIVEPHYRGGDTTP